MSAGPLPDADAGWCFGDDTIFELLFGALKPPILHFIVLSSAREREEWRAAFKARGARKTIILHHILLVLMSCVQVPRRPIRRAHSKTPAKWMGSRRNQFYAHGNDPTACMLRAHANVIFNISYQAASIHHANSGTQSQLFRMCVHCGSDYIT